MKPRFEFIPIVPSDAGIGVVSLEGISTRHESESTDQGRLYGRIADDGVNWSIEFFTDFDRTPERLVASGSVAKNAASLASIAIAPQNDSTISGRVKLAADVDEIDFVAIVSFAVDADVMSDDVSISKFPGYDAEFGLAFFHARAMKRILASDLPAQAPSIYAANPINPFVPHTAGTMPDVTRVANPDALREAQADLVRFMSAKERNHVAEWAEIAALASDDYESHLAALKAANAPADEDAKDSSPANATISIGSFRRA